MLIHHPVQLHLPFSTMQQDCNASTSTSVCSIRDKHCCMSKAVVSLSEIGDICLARVGPLFVLASLGTLLALLSLDLHSEQR